MNPDKSNRNSFWRGGLNLRRESNGEFGNCTINDLLKLKLTVLGISLPEDSPDHFSASGEIDFESELGEKFAGTNWPEKGETMIGFKRLSSLESCIIDTLKNNIAGDLIETGVWRGGACILMRGILKAYGIKDKNVWLADSFQGLPAPNPELYPPDKGDMLHSFRELAVSLEEVKHNFAKYGLLDDQVKFLKGWFRDTMPSVQLEKLSVLRLDGDMYESTIDVLFNLYPKLSIGGYCIVDDYGAIKACKSAVDDYRRIFGIDDEIRAIDWTGVFWKKTKEIRILPSTDFYALIHQNPTADSKMLPDSIFMQPLFNDTPSAWVEHIPFAFFLIDKLNPSVFVELGTHYGNSYFAFCQAIRDLNVKTKATAIDTWTGDEDAGFYGQEVFDYVSGINQHHFQPFSNLLKLSFDEALPNFENGSIDLLHIDGSHNYEAVKHDFDSWLPKMSSRGVILFHDTNVSNPAFGVTRLMREISGRYPNLEFKHGYGLSVLCTGSEASRDFLNFIFESRNDLFVHKLFENLGNNLTLTAKVNELSAKITHMAEAGLMPSTSDPDTQDLYYRMHANDREVTRLRTQIDLLQHSIGLKEDEIVKQQFLISSIIGSRSWRITAPVRRLSEIFALNRRILRSQGLKTWWIYVVQYLRKILVNTRVGHLYQAITANQDQAITVRQVGKVPPHLHPVDIIICVHDAIQDVKSCLSSLIQSTHPPYNLILVDDGSGTETRLFLEDFARDQGALLLRNEKAQGYTKAANRGMKAATGPFILLLNSDTVVGHMEWLDRLVFCANRSKKTGIVSPLSNTASWQSVPWVIQGEDWAGNALPPDISVEQMARMVAESSGMLCPEIPFLNGFCLLIKSACLKSIGYFDEIAFPRGYGEENDLCLRAANSGWKLAVADDVYVYHAQSKSYSDEVRLKLSAESGDALNRKHSSIRVADGVEKCRNNLPLLGIRSRAEKYPLMIRLQQECRSLYGGKKLLFVLPVAAIGGGANVIIQEIRALRKMQIDCYIANQSEFREWFVRAYPFTDIPVIYYDGPVSLADHLGYFDAVIATTNSSVQLIRSALRHAKSGIVTGYYIQDFEPLFYPEGSAAHQEAMDSYTLIPDMRCFTKTEWNRREVFSHTGINPGTAAPSIDLDTFRPVSDKHFKGKLVVVAMIRPETPYRAPELTMEVLRTIKAKYTGDVEIFTFGCNPAADIIRRNRKLFRFRHFGILSPEQLASLFNTTHVFIDMSLFQAMGLTGMEAMACANAVILPKTGGAESFISHEKNGFLADTSNLNDCLNYFERLANDRNYLYNVACQAAGDICLHSPAYSAHNILKCLFQSGNV